MPTKTQIKKLAEKAEEACIDLRDALQEYLDDKSEGWIDGEAGEEWSGKIDAADQAVDYVNDARPE